MPDVCPIGTEIQTLIFSRDRFHTEASARRWASDHGFKADFVDEKENTYRIRQENPKRYAPKSFRTIPLGKDTGVQAVIGCPKGA